MMSVVDFEWISVIVATIAASVALKVSTKAFVLTAAALTFGGQLASILIYGTF